MFKIKLLIKKCRIGRGVKFENKKNINISNYVSIGKESIISGYAGGTLSIENGAIICSKCKIATCGGNITIGEFTQVGDNSVITGQGGVEIGKNVLMADGISIISNEHLYNNINIPIMKQGQKSNKISIGDGTWIGINSTILSGIRVGKNCVIGANSVVTKDIPDYCVVAGVPAKIIKRYDVKLKEWVKL